MESEELDLLNYEIERRRLCEPLRFFKPNAAQVKFINAILDPGSRIILFPAGNWCGKTMSAIAALGACIWPNQAEYPIFNNPLFKDWTGKGYPKRARIVSTPKELEMNGSIQVEIDKWWPKGQYTPHRKGKQFDSEFVTNTGWIVDLMSYEQKATEFEGATIPFFIFNEPCPEDIFDACCARMKFGGKVLMPMTPLADSAWIYDRLVANDGIDGIRVVYGETHDNCREHSVNGVLPHSAIEALERGIPDPDDRAARLHGKFMHMAGQIYKTFKRDVHTFKLDTDLTNFLSGKQIIQINDPAIGKPCAVIYCAISHIGTLEVFDELPKVEFQGAKDSDLTVNGYINLFRATEEGRKINRRIMDKRFGSARRTLGGPTLKEEFRDAVDENNRPIGIDYEDSYTSDDKTEIETGILKVKSLLAYNKDKPIDGLNRPRLMIADHCINTIHAFERWRRDPKTGKPMEEYKDFSDCVRYLACSDPEIEFDRPWEQKVAHYGVGN